MYTRNKNNFKQNNRKICRSIFLYYGNVKSSKNAYFCVSCLKNSDNNCRKQTVNGDKDLSPYFNTSFFFSPAIFLPKFVINVT